MNATNATAAPSRPQDAATAGTAATVATTAIRVSMLAFGPALVAITMVATFRIESASGQAVRQAAAPPVWSPRPSASPLREIWSFDTGG
ncbi:MAG: hypothetical protein ACRENJ_04415 [Candidatus Eiseniibacteriota bacterium]